jgi:hypothetical protein
MIEDILPMNWEIGRQLMLFCWMWYDAGGFLSLGMTSEDFAEGSKAYVETPLKEIITHCSPTAQPYTCCTTAHIQSVMESASPRSLFKI